MAGYRRDGSFFWMLRSDYRAMGRVLDVVWSDFCQMAIIREARHPFKLITKSCHRMIYNAFLGIP